MSEIKSFLKKIKTAQEARDKSRLKFEERGFADYFAKSLPFTYRITAAPIQILDYNHPLNDVSKNVEMLKKIETGKFVSLYKGNEGELRFYQQVIAFVNEKNEKPIGFFYVFYPITFDGKEAIQNFYMWRDAKVTTKVDGMSLRNYCVFKVLLPNVNIIVSADQHTEAGENASKSLLKDALKRNLFVYYTDEEGKLEQFHSLSELDNDFWGTTVVHGKRVTVISNHEINEKG